MAAGPITRFVIQRAVSWWATHSTEGIYFQRTEPTQEGSVLVEWTGTDVEMRKLAVRWARTPSAGGAEDVDVCTWTFLRLDDSDVPTNDWSDPTHYSAIESAFDTCWTGLKGAFNPNTKLSQYRWSKDGPAWRVSPTPYNPAVRVTDRSVVGSAAGGALMAPPQVATTVTEKTSRRDAWGRFYFPAPTTAKFGADGRIDSTYVATLLSTWVTFYNTCRAARLVPVVYAPALPVRDRHRNGVVVGSMPARDDVVYEVDTLQVDDLFDIIRSRRWRNPTLRSNTALAALP
jgi:hypothetical protein